MGEKSYLFYGEIHANISGLRSVCVCVRACVCVCVFVFVCVFARARVYPYSFVYREYKNAFEG